METPTEKGYCATCGRSADDVLYNGHADHCYPTPPPAHDQLDALCADMAKRREALAPVKREGHMKLPTERIVSRIVDGLFTNGFGEQAERLVMTIDHPTPADLGGWNRLAVAAIVREILKQEGRADV
jgi:hypothetical protein